MIKKIIFFVFVMLGSITMFAQTSISGTVKDATRETLWELTLKFLDKQWERPQTLTGTLH